MTAIPVTAPRRLRPARPVGRRVAPPVARHAQRTHARDAARARPVRAVDGAARAPRRPVRLTRRGRLTITGLLTACGIGATLWTGAVSLAGTQPERVPVRYVSVAPGDTLWSIAGETAPGQDRRDTVHRIVELNALTSPELAVGQRVAVPAGR
jgi:hypothetical protein